VKIAFAVVAFVLVFVVGIALGEALHDNQAPSGTQTLVRTLQPLPLAPAAEGTITVTTTVAR
jgi:ABC-type molybdate transport system permease subunit